MDKPRLIQFTPLRRSWARRDGKIQHSGDETSLKLNSYFLLLQGKKNFLQITSDLCDVYLINSNIAIKTFTRLQIWICIFWECEYLYKRKFLFSSDKCEENKLWHKWYQSIYRGAYLSWSNYKYDTLVCTALKIKASTRSILRKSFVFIYKSYNKWRILSDNRLATIALATNHTLGLYIRRCNLHTTSCHHTE